jgi:Flp pilus assembly protein TadD
VLTESLKYNRLDSPAMRALHAQRKREKQPQHADIEPLLIEADNALRNKDWIGAVGKFTEALDDSPDNVMVLMKRGIVYRDQGDFRNALSDFTRVIELSPDYAEAYREKGIAENKEYRSQGNPAHMPTGEASLRRATELKPDDFDAFASLGGVLKREGNMKAAGEAYRRATDISHGNTYPLLNEIKIEAHAAGKFALDEERELMLARAQDSLKAQVENKYNQPWSAFDLAEVCLYTGDPDGFMKYLKQGLIVCTSKW